MDETHVPSCVGPEVEFGSTNYTQMLGDVQMGLDDLIYDFNIGEKVEMHLPKTRGKGKGKWGLMT